MLTKLWAEPVVQGYREYINENHAPTTITQIAEKGCAEFGYHWDKTQFEIHLLFVIYWTLIRALALQCMGVMVFQITGTQTVCSTFCSGKQQRRHQGPVHVLLAHCIWGEYSLHKRTVMRKALPCCWGHNNTKRYFKLSPLCVMPWRLINARPSRKRVLISD